jgi:hypothetical protein
MRNLIFSEKSIVFTGNDNSSAPDGFYDRCKKPDACCVYANGQKLFNFTDLGDECVETHFEYTLPKNKQNFAKELVHNCYFRELVTKGSGLEFQYTHRRLTYEEISKLVGNVELNSSFSFTYYGKESWGDEYEVKPPAFEVPVKITVKSIKQD